MDRNRATCISQLADLTSNGKATARGLEPLRAEPNGFLVHHLSHSVTLSCGMLRSTGLVPHARLLGDALACPMLHNP